ncbi:MAG: hypothetical protein ACLQQ4_09655 [Bacteroidia bacterium]
MGDIAFCAFYLLLFSIIILKSNLFNLPGLNNRYSLAAFCLKLLVGIILWYIYSYYYKNRYTADIFKYYDDGKYMYQNIHTNFSVFIRMLTGIGDSGEPIQGYYHSMKSWINGHDSTIYNNSHFIIRINALLMLFSGGHYGVYVLFFCFVSLIGLAYIYKSFYPYLKDSPKILFAVVFLFPSVLLWSSGDLKEVFVFLGLGISIYYFLKILHKEGSSVKNIMMVILSFILLIETKAYVLLCIVPGFISEAAIKKIKIAGRYPWMSYIVITSAYLLLGLNINIIYPDINPLKTLAEKQADFMHLAKGGIYLIQVSDEIQYAYIPEKDSTCIIPANKYSDSLLKKKGIQYLASSEFCYWEETTKNIALYRLKPGLMYDLIRMKTGDTLHLAANDSNTYRVDSYIEPAKSRISISPLKPTLSGLISYLPTALAISLIRPFPNEIHSKAVWIYFCENVIILLLIVFALIFSKKKNTHNNMVAFCVSYCLLMLVLIGISTPLYGGIERYKSVVIPFMLILLLMIYDKEKFKRILKN